MKTRWFMLALGLIFASASQAMVVSGVELPRDRDGLRLSGAGVLRKGFVFRIYIGALYLDNQVDGRCGLRDVRKRIDIHYFHHTPKKYMLRTAVDTLKNNLPADEYEELSPKIAQLHTAFLNGQKGSIASILHEPGKGLLYLFDDKLITTIPGDDFANAYFSIWLGESPSSKSIKKAMLSGIRNE